MKKLTIAVSIFFMALSLACAETQPESTVHIDETFQKTNTWLNQQNLALTGGPGGRDDSTAFSQESILFYGEGLAGPNHTHPAQRELMAKRAAVVSAQRSLAEYLQGFALVGDTTVKDGMAQSDVIKSSVSGYVKGAQVVFQEYSREKDMAVAIIKLGLRGPKEFASILYDRMLNDPKIRRSLTELDGKPVPSYRQKPESLLEKHDGLIIDARAQRFRPALINRIFSSKGELLYDPTKISQKVLIDQGCGEYTNSIEKAKAALEKRGVNHPMVVTASGIVSASDLQVSEEDAAKIFSADEKGNFLASAKVAFVLK
jgi:hypothetical protein